MNKETKEFLEEVKRPKTVGEMLPQTIIYLVMGILVVLKALGMIAIGWWWITLPIWLPIAIGFGMLALALVILLVGGVCFGIASLFDHFS